MWTDKQKEYINNANKRWNIKVGATGTGKTYVDYNFMIPYRVRSLQDTDGICLIVGVTSSTIERNVLKPMRDTYGEELVGNIIKGSGTVNLFGETFYVIGAEKENATNKIQGSTVKYIYGDEFVNWNKTFFKMLTTRLRTEGAIADLTGNPSTPTHWAKEFIDKMLEEDLAFYQTSTIYDNPILPKDFVKAQEIELKGTAEYDRLLLGRWAVSEGAIYNMFNDNMIISDEKFKEISRYNESTRTYDNCFVSIGIDFGGNQSSHTFKATAISNRYEWIIPVIERKIDGVVSPSELDAHFVSFTREVLDKGFKIDDIRADNADPVLIKGLNQALYNERIYYKVVGCLKHPINERISVYQRLMNSGKFFVHENCPITVQAIKNAVWDDKTDSKGKDIRLDDGTSDIDTLDAQEYSTERYHKRLIGG